MKYYLPILFISLSTLIIAQEDTILHTYSKEELLSDYDLTVASLKESHPGLYWYTDYAQYERLFQESRAKIEDGMNSYEFFRIISTLVAADKEGHSDVYRSSNISDHVNQSAKLLPFAVIPIDGELVLVSDIENHSTKGFILKAINEVDIDTVIQSIFNHQSKWADGFTSTGKWHNIEYFNFSFAYHYYISDLQSESASLTLLNPSTEELLTLETKLISKDELRTLSEENPYKFRKNDDVLFKLEFEHKDRTAILTFNDFSYDRYERHSSDFETIVDSLFAIIRTRNSAHLIIDIRNNSGGSEGAEDYLFSHLAKREYEKYEYVEAMGFDFTFLYHSNFRSDEDRRELKEMLSSEHYRAKDGRILRKKQVLPTAAPQEKIFSGKLYVLISGRTYSGGSEFAAIVKDQSDSVFIGEETGGAFYGQTSGSYVHLFLPNTDLHIRIPLLKFVTTFEHEDIPLGRGVIPDIKKMQSYEDYINGIDSPMNYTLDLIFEAE